MFLVMWVLGGASLAHSACQSMRRALSSHADICNICAHMQPYPQTATRHLPQRVYVQLRVHVALCPPTPLPHTHSNPCVRLLEGTIALVLEGR